MAESEERTQWSPEAREATTQAFMALDTLTKTVREIASHPHAPVFDQRAQRALVGAVTTSLVYIDHLANMLNSQVDSAYRRTSDREHPSQPRALSYVHHMCKLIESAKQAAEEVNGYFNYYFTNDSLRDEEGRIR